uniref:Uncharacterized protein n=1 Tax=Arundo donax TaxID=35708 RepID=A0A0A9A6V1_ARUDO
MQITLYFLQFINHTYQLNPTPTAQLPIKILSQDEQQNSPKAIIRLHLHYTSSDQNPRTKRRQPSLDVEGTHWLGVDLGRGSWTVRMSLQRRSRRITRGRGSSEAASSSEDEQE